MFPSSLVCAVHVLSLQSAVYCDIHQFRFAVQNCGEGGARGRGRDTEHVSTFHASGVDVGSGVTISVGRREKVREGLKII